MQAQKPFIEMAVEHCETYSPQELVLEGISQEKPPLAPSSVMLPVETSLHCVGTDTVVVLPTQEPITFEDIAVLFSEGEWAMLNCEQKSLYKEVTVENANNVVFLGDGLETENYTKQIGR
ncbi:zinc finger protein [Crotalus adamanteus]|uniref:Zinc finger protein n=1 Tax=Crotalus adamanteus TaxID=8729 RepID=A0AAW1BTL3_CROAD